MCIYVFICICMYVYIYVHVCTCIRPVARNLYQGGKAPQNVKTKM